MRSVSSIVQMIATAIAISTCERRRADGAGRTTPDAAAAFTVAMCRKLTTVRVLDIIGVFLRVSDQILRVAPDSLPGGEHRHSVESASSALRQIGL